MKLTINYKNGNTITTEVNYVHVEGGCIWYTRKSKVSSIGGIINTPIENVDSWEVTE